MLGGVKFIPRDQLNTNEGSDSSIKQRKKLGSKKEKPRSRKKSSQNYSSDDEEPEKIKKGSRRNKKWYSSDEHSFSSWSESEGGSDLNENNRPRSGKAKKPSDGSSMDKSRHKVKKRLQRNRKHHSSESYSSFASESDGSDNSVGSKDDHRGRRKQESTKFKQKGVRQATAGEVLSDDDRGRLPQDDKEFVRKEMGLEWMVKPMDKSERSSQTDDPPQEPQVKEVRKPNPREMNPYLRDDGSGYPEDADQPKVSGGQLLSSSVVGDGGASWRMKALKRSQEQAAREGRKLDEVVEERWGSLGQLAVSVASRAAAPTHAHLRAIRERKRRVIENHETVADDIKEREGEKVYGDNREYLRDVSIQNPRMREPRVHDSLSWRKRNVQKPSREEDTWLISDAASSLNKFSNDGSFMNEVTSHCNRDARGSIGSSNTSSVGKEPMETEMVSLGTDNTKEAPVMQILSANQLAAKALQLRMKGKHEEAEKLLNEAENSKTEQEKKTKLSKLRMEGSVSRYVKHDISIRHKKKEEDADMHLAQKIVQNKKYSIASQADQEYDYEDIPSRKRHQRSGELPKHKETQNNIMAKRILTQQERCHFCFENPTRPKHLIVSIANFTYMMLPQSQSIVSGHCCILPMQHESATRSVDNNVWEEIRNFKKCLITMFSKQEKDVIFLETVMGLAQQRRHCLVECIPLPREIAKEAPLYFKKAIDEAEDEWSQHNAKKLIDTSEKGLRGSIPKDFPYFHVEFGLKRGFVHVIDDEKQFTSSLGLNVIRGMLRLPEEDMYRRRKHESVETQKQAVASFVKEWQHFDWTKQLD